MCQPKPEFQKPPVVVSFIGSSTKFEPTRTDK